MTESRQVFRARQRRDAKEAAENYPRAKVRHVRPTGKRYAPNGAREVARRLRQVA